MLYNSFNNLGLSSIDNLRYHIRLKYQKFPIANKEKRPKRIALQDITQNQPFFFITCTVPLS